MYFEIKTMIGVGLVLSTNSLLAISPAKQMNVLFICVDDLRPDLGCYGNEIVQTPSLDKLAGEGCLFLNHYTQIPTSGASRASMLTGKLPQTKKHLSNDAAKLFISDKPEGVDHETFIHAFKRAGYKTVNIGKVSHSADGFLYGYSHPQSSKRELPHSWDEIIYDAGKWETGWNAFFAYADGSNRQSKKKQVFPYECADVADEDYPDGLIANLSVRKLKELASHSEPFFMGVGFYKPHLPFNAPKKYWDLYTPEEVGGSPCGDVPCGVNRIGLHDSHELSQYLLGDEQISLQNKASDAYAAKLRHAYFACISYVDAQIGKLLETLRDTGLEKNTIVVVWGDHGWHLGDLAMWGKHTVFDTALRSSFIIKYPEAPQNVVCKDVVSSIDIYPTLVDLCNVEGDKTIDGESLKPALFNYSAKGRNYAYSYFNNGISVRTPQYRLTRYHNSDSTTVTELFDYSGGRYERQNLASKHPEIVRLLTPLLDNGDTGLYKK